MDSQLPIIQKVNRFLIKKSFFLKAIQKQLFFIVRCPKRIDGFDKKMLIMSMLLKLTSVKFF